MDKVCYYEYNDKIGITKNNFENDICLYQKKECNKRLSEGKHMVQIITDSSTLMTEAEGKELGIDVIPLCINIMDEEYRDLQMDMDSFYAKIAQGVPEVHSRLLGNLSRHINVIRAIKF